MASNFPQRIVSLVPSITETLIDLGLGNRLVGRTKFCVEPATDVEDIPIMGGTKNFHIDRVKAARPDLIIANKEENDRDRMLHLIKLYPTWVTELRTLEDAVSMIREMAKRLDCPAAMEMADDIISAFDSYDPPIHRSRVAYLIWKNPIMAAGGDTFIHAMLTEAGYENVFGDRLRYPETDENELLALDTDMIFLSSEPFPFQEKHIEHFASVGDRITPILVDGTYFSWYGSRLLKAPEYFASIAKLATKYA